jgi:hypothetical protein
MAPVKVKGKTLGIVYAKFVAIIISPQVHLVFHNQGNDSYPDTQYHTLCNAIWLPWLYQIVVRYDHASKMNSLIKTNYCEEPVTLVVLPKMRCCSAGAPVSHEVENSIDNHECPTKIHEKDAINDTMFNKNQIALGLVECHSIGLEDKISQEMQPNYDNNISHQFYHPLSMHLLHIVEHYDQTS